MHILKIIHGYPPRYNAGSEVYSQSICNELKKRHRVSIFTREENPYAADYRLRHERLDGLDFYYINKAREKDGYAHRAVDEALARLIDADRPDVAHIGHLNHLSVGLVDVLHQAGIPIVFTLHDFWLMCPRGQFLQINFGDPDFHQLCDGQDHKKCAERCYNRFFSGLETTRAADERYWESWIGARMAATRAISEKVSYFIAPARSLRERFVREFGIPEDKIQYLDYGFPTHYLQPTAPKPRSCYTFGYIGTHIPAKGVNLLIEAFKQLNGEAKLFIYGRPSGQSSEALRQMAADSPNPIEFRGEYINQHLGEVVFSEVDCIVVPSIWVENSPLVIHEAQACKIPVITADVGGMSEYVQHLENGLLFRHRSVESLAEQLQFALEQPEQMRRLGQRGYWHHPEGLVPDIATHCQQLETFYSSLLAVHGGTAHGSRFLKPLFTL